MLLRGCRFVKRDEVTQALLFFGLLEQADVVAMETEEGPGSGEGETVSGTMVRESIVFYVNIVNYSLNDIHELFHSAWPTVSVVTGEPVSSGLLPTAGVTQPQ